MKKLLLILLCLPFIGFGQGWIRGYVNAYAYSVDQTNDGGYILAGGISTPNNNSDIWLLKTDGQGNQQWVNTFGTTERDVCHTLQKTSDGCYILAGYIGETASSDGEIWASKVDSFGNSLWSNTYGPGRSIYSIEQTNDGGFVFAGSGEKILKIDTNGNLEWSHNYDSLEEITHLTKTLDGGFIIAGLDTTMEMNPCVMKIDSLGIKQWKKIYGSNNTDWQQISSSQEISGGIILVGEQEFTSGPNIDTTPIWLIKTTILGDTLWEKSFLVDSFPIISARSIQQTIDGGFIISGFLYNYQNEMDIVLLKTDTNGVKQWAKIFGGIGIDASFSVRQTLDGGYIIAGLSESHTLIKTDGNGNVTSTFNIPTPNSNRKLEKVIDILGRETKGKKNEPLLYIYDDGTVEKRIVID